MICKYLFLYAPNAANTWNLIFRYGQAAPAPAAGADIDPALRQVLAQFLAAQGGAGGQGGAARQPAVPLEAVLTRDVLQQLLSDEAACKEMQELPGQALK